MAFLRHPDLLILDEVTANLDSRNAALLWEQLDNLFQNQQRMAILMVSHDLKFAKHTATTALFMKAGQLVKTIGNIELANISFDDFLKEYHTACWG
jgi:ABC-type glutathione transport system ATPase component